MYGIHVYSPRITARISSLSRAIWGRTLMEEDTTSPRRWMSISKMLASAWGRAAREHRPSTFDEPAFIRMELSSCVNRISTTAVEALETTKKTGDGILERYYKRNWPPGLPLSALGRASTSHWRNFCLICCTPYPVKVEILSSPVLSALCSRRRPNTLKPGP